MWTVYDKTGETARCTVSELEYSGEWMGDCTVSIDVESAEPVDFAIGDYLDYRGERFYMNYDPTTVKKAARGKAGDAFKYEGVKFYAAQDELTRCDFLDFVKEDNGIHFTALPDFSFYASTVADLAERIQVNLDRLYTGDSKWTVEVHPEYAEKTDRSISVNNIKVWEALALAPSEFGAYFVIRGRTITIGTAGIETQQMFRHGRGNGLYEIERTADEDQSIVTRLRAYGNTTNLPARYYNSLSDANLGNYLPDNMAVKRLMLPAFPYETLDPYIDSANAETLGIREGTVIFDGSDDLDDIYPTIEGMTGKDLMDARIMTHAYSTQRLDEIRAAEQITDSGVFEDGDTVPAFTVQLCDIGFNINDYLSGEAAATISMKSGMCGGREFEITGCVQYGAGWKLTLNRVEDADLDMYFPNKDYQIERGDRFVLLNIEMPEFYIKAASQRLLRAAQAWLAENDYTRYTYQPKVDEIFMARQHDAAMASGGLTESLHDTIKEGDIMHFEDEDLGIAGNIVIDTLSIKEGDKMIPTYEITLKEEKTAGTLDRIKAEIDSIASGLGQGMGGYTAEQIRQMIRLFGGEKFVSKISDDTVRGLLTFVKGLQGEDYESGLSGWALKSDPDTGRTYLEVDEVWARERAVLNELEIRRITAAGGAVVISPASCTIESAEEQGMPLALSDSAGNPLYDSAGNPLYAEDTSEGAEQVWICRIKTTDGTDTIVNEFRAGDLARCAEYNTVQTTDGTTVGRSWWRLVVAVGTDWIALSETDCEEGSDTPQAGDRVVCLGSRTDTARQSAVMLEGYGAEAPSLRLLTGITDYTIGEDNIPVKVSPEENRFTGTFLTEAGEDLTGLIDGKAATWYGPITASTSPYGQGYKKGDIWAGCTGEFGTSGTAGYRNYENEILRCKSPAQQVENLITGETEWVFSITDWVLAGGYTSKIEQTAEQISLSVYGLGVDTRNYAVMDGAVTAEYDLTTATQQTSLQKVAPVMRGTLTAGETLYVVAAYTSYANYMTDTDTAYLTLLGGYGQTRETRTRLALTLVDETEHTGTLTGQITLTEDMLTADSLAFYVEFTGINNYCRVEISSLMASRVEVSEATDAPEVPLVRTGIDIADGTITLQGGRTFFRTADGQDTVRIFTDEGKIEASLIDADRITARRVTAESALGKVDIADGQMTMHDADGELRLLISCGSLSAQDTYDESITVQNLTVTVTSGSTEQSATATAELVAGGFKAEAGGTAKLPAITVLATLAPDISEVQSGAALYIQADLLLDGAELDSAYISGVDTFNKHDKELTLSAVFPQRTLALKDSDEAHTLTVRFTYDAEKDYIAAATYTVTTTENLVVMYPRGIVEVASDGFRTAGYGVDASGDEAASFVEQTEEHVELGFGPFRMRFDKTGISYTGDGWSTPKYLIKA